MGKIVKANLEIPYKYSFMSHLASGIPILTLCCAYTFAADESSDYRYTLALSPAALTQDANIVLGDQYRTVGVDVQNRTDRIVSYDIYGADVICPEGEVRLDNLEGKLVQPGGSNQIMSGVLLPGSGSRVTLDSVGMSKRQGLGLLGPVSVLVDCTYSLSVKFFPINEYDFSLEESNVVSIRRTVNIK